MESNLEINDLQPPVRLSKLDLFEAGRKLKGYGYTTNNKTVLLHPKKNSILRNFKIVYAEFRITENKGAMSIYVSTQKEPFLSPIEFKLKTLYNKKRLILLDEELTDSYDIITSMSDIYSLEDFSLSYAFENRW